VRRFFRAVVQSLSRGIGMANLFHRYTRPSGGLMAETEHAPIKGPTTSQRQVPTFLVRPVQQAPQISKTERGDACLPDAPELSTLEERSDAALR